MKRTKTMLFIFFFLTSSMVIPVVFVAAQSDTPRLKLSLIQAEDNCTFTWATGLSAFNWWGPSTYIWCGGDYMRNNALQPLFSYQNSASSTITDAIPILANNYTIVDTWPEEINDDGWTNTGGIRVVDVELRENVKFHDGSEFNATAAKWNFDRQITLLGNLTGSLVWTQWKHTLFRPARDMRYFFTNSWNFSYLYSDDPVLGAPVTPDYYGKDNDPNKSWTSVNKTYTVDGWYPIINKTIIIKNASETASGTGGTLRFEFNDWQTGLNYLGQVPIISYAAYKDWPYPGGGFYTQIWDEYDGVDPYWGAVPFLVGTGPYKAVSVDKVTNEQMIMERFDDYWNFTALRDDEKFIVKDLIIQYYVSGLTQQERTTALISGDIDGSLDGPYGALYPEQIIPEPSVDYFDTGIGESIEQFIFIWPETDKALRKAVNFAFNYTNYILVAHEGRAVRTYNALGQDSYWLNTSIIGAYTDFTIARETLLNDSLYGPLLNLEGITAGSTTQNWHDFADDIANGVLNSTYLEAFTLNYFHDGYDEAFTNQFELSLADIGMVINKSGADLANPYGDWKLTGVGESVFDKLIYGLAPYADHMEGFIMDWPVPRLEIGYWDAYYTTVSYFYEAGGFWLDWQETWNYGLTNDATNSKLIHSLYFQDETERQKTYDEIVKWHTQQEFPNMYITQDETGYALSRKFSVVWYWGGAWGGYSMFPWIGIGPGIVEAGLPIPGFPTSILILFSVVSIIAISYTIMKKKNIA